MVKLMEAVLRLEQLKNLRLTLKARSERAQLCPQILDTILINNLHLDSVIIIP